MKTYESVIVIDSLLKSEEIEAIIEKVERIINNNGGQIKEIDRWGKKRLAYEIKKRQYGYYVEFIFTGPSNLIQVLEKDYGLDENILRYLTVHLNKRAIEHKERAKIAQGPEKAKHTTAPPAKEKSVAPEAEPEEPVEAETEKAEAKEEEVIPAAEDTGAVEESTDAEN